MASRRCADRLIERCGGIDAREMKAQLLDSMDIERERGITIKAQTVRLKYTAKDGESYVLHLMDTPGHVDFAYEVSRSLSACEGSILLVDASQGVEAQTLANVYQAIDVDHEIVVVLNKIDLPAADPDRVRQQIEDVVGLDASNAIAVSAKTGEGIDDVLEALVEKLPPPKGDASAPLSALLVDSWYDPYSRCRHSDPCGRWPPQEGHAAKDDGDRSRVPRWNALAFSRPRRWCVDALGPGEIGFITAGIKEVADTNVGDTLTDAKKPAPKPLPGFKPSVPVVFCGLFPARGQRFSGTARELGAP